jgi:L-lactate utilization protein LutB
MNNPVDRFWHLRMNEVKENLEKNKFEVFVAATTSDAKGIFLKEILPEINPASVSWGGSMTFTGTGLYDLLKSNDTLEVLDTFDKDLPNEDKQELRRKALLTDLFITGTNAITEDGMLVNLDMIGNRVGAITYGPRHVVLFVGRNKIVPDLEAAMLRIKDFVAPANSIRLDMETPCTQTGRCQDCSSPKRICNSWVVTEKSFPPGRIKIILINEDLGL